MEYLKHNTLLFIILSIGITFLFSVIINSILLKFSQNLGVRVNSINQIRWSNTSKPSLGGISFYVIFLISFIILNFINNVSPLHYSNLKLTGILVVCSLAFLMGLADDAYNTKPLLKFIVQLVCGLILYFTHTKINMFTSEVLNLSFTVLWVVGLMNSINMLDNMDGITTIVSIVILFFVIFLNYNLQNVFSATSILSLGVLGALLGFLIYNWNPAKMFMGDTGSQFLGVFLAAISIESCWNSFEVVHYSFMNLNSIFLGFMVSICVFIIPLVDTTTVFINRLRKGNSPFIGGKDHTTHHLFFRGINEKKIALLYGFIQLLGLFIALNLIVNYNLFYSIISIVFAATTFSTLYLNTIIKKK